MIVCVLIPRFALLAALGDRRALLSEPVALAPEAGREQMVGEASAAAEATGVAAGMRMGEALSRCPVLRLVPPDPEGARSLWHEVLDRIESIGGAPESERAGAAFFEAAGMQGIHGGDLAGCWRPPAGRWAAAPGSALRHPGSPPSAPPAGRVRAGRRRWWRRVRRPLPGAAAGRPAALAAGAGRAARRARPARHPDPG